VSIGADRLLGCRGEAWTYDGVPISPGTPSLQRFPTSVRTGAVVADFTRPLSARLAGMLARRTHSEWS
jgi:hypothetical protein